MIDENIVKQVAQLANIDVSPKEEQSLGQQMSKIINYIDKLKKVNTEGVEPMRGLHSGENVFRQDKTKTSDCRQDILNNAPLRQGEYFKIPKVIE